MKKVLGYCYLGTILTSLALMGCEKNYPIKGVRLTEERFSNQAELGSTLREKSYTVDFLEIGRERDGFLRIVSRNKGKSLVSVTLIEERDLEVRDPNSPRVLSVPVKTFTEECHYENEDAVTRKMLEEAKDYRLSEDYFKKADAKVKDVMGRVY